jgi:predicted signal transduction protein with EAL and GGDEF domain
VGRANARRAIESATRSERLPAEASHGRLQLDVVAEGIETAQQLQTLHQLGCARGQGFLFGKPAPSAKLAAALITRSRLPTDSNSAQRHAS